MSLSVAQVYSVRFGTKLPLPKIVQDNIAKLRITPVTYKPFRPPPRHHHRPKLDPAAAENWRLKVLSNYVSRLKDQGDPDYFEIFAILNKLTSANLGELSGKALEYLDKRDEEFRLRVTTLVFDKAVRESMFAPVLADFAVKLNSKHPDVAEDLSTHAKMFTKLYDINDTLTYPSTEEPDYTDKVIRWMKQKENRRGYAKFLTQLFVRGLISEDIMIQSIQDVLNELNTTSKQARTQQTDENTTQYVDFLYESSKILPTSATKLKTIIKTSLASVLAIPRPEVPSLCMRSRFRLEDALKCVQ